MLGISIFLGINYKFYSIKMFLRSIFFQIVTFVVFFMLFTDALVAMGLVFVISYFEYNRINKINAILSIEPSRASSDQIQQSVKLYIDSHHNYCTHLIILNNYWHNLYLAFIFTSLPMNLTLKHQLLFESIPLQVRFFYLICSLLDDTLLFGIQYYFAAFSLKIHKVCVKLSRLQWSLNGYPFRMRIKMKLLMCFERLSSTHKFGVKMGPVVMTFALFSMVILFLI